MTGQVYVDQYKNSIYRSVKSDPFLSRCTTLDPRATRFHACERKHRCEECRVTDFTGQRIWNRDKLVVMVMMQEEKSAAWEVERREFLNKLGRAAKGEGAWPEQIVSVTHAQVSLRPTYSLSTHRTAQLRDIALYRNCKPWLSCSARSQFRQTPWRYNSKVGITTCFRICLPIACRLRGP